MVVGPVLGTGSFGTGPTIWSRSIGGGEGSLVSTTYLNRTQGGTS